MCVCVSLSLDLSRRLCFSLSLSTSLSLSLQFAVTLFFEDVTPVSQNASRSTTPQNIASSNTTSGSSEGLSKPTPSNAAQQQVRRRAGHTLRVPSTYGAVGARSSQDDGVQQQQQQGDGDGDGDAEGGTAEMRRATAATSSSGVRASGGGIQRLHRPPSLRPTRPSPRLDEGVRRSRILQGSVRSTLRMEQSACRGERDVVGDAEVGKEAEKEVKEEGEEEA